MLISAEDRLTRARIVLERRGVAACDLLPPPISDSWTRCLAAGLDPQSPPAPAAADARMLRDERQSSELLRRLAVAEMQSLGQQIAGTNFMIALATPGGMLLDTVTDDSSDATARASSIRPGTLWGEAHCGTNALGTVAFTGKPILVHGAEHFFSRYGALTCVAAPIVDGAGEIVGILDASSDCHSRQRHTSALVAMAVTQIENGLFRERHRDDVVVAFHPRSEFLHTLGVGLLAFDRDGHVLGANAQARALPQAGAALPGRHFDQLFRTRFAEFIDASRGQERQRVEDRAGSAYAAKLETLARPRRPPPPAVKPAASAPAFIAPAFIAPAFVADDPVAAAAVRLVERAVARRLPVLIYGETGTGKEQLARHAHTASGRRGAFVPVNCAALTDTLVEAELFGHADGAFTGARRGGAAGLVMEADGGTLFLDEIGDMRLGLQSVLLRLLDDWTVRPVGGGRRRGVDVQLVAATNIDLAAAVATGRFRADLFYRLNTTEVQLPPLRERTDFARVADHLLAAVAPGCRMAEAAMEALQRQPWRGNIRELRSVLTRLALSDPGSVIGAAAVTAVGNPAPRPSGPASLKASQRARIAAAHREAGGNVSATARRLGVSRNTIYRALAGGGRLGCSFG